MAHVFDDAVIDAVLRHMNTDHADDNLLIVRAFGPAYDAEITGAEMIGFDGVGADWRVILGDTVEQLRIAWPGGAISERPEVRREVVALYDAACARLGVPARGHEQGP